MKKKSVDQSKISVIGESIEKLVSVRRVSKVVKGGTIFTVAALVVVGDTKGIIGYGVGKHKEVSEARIKAVRSAKALLMRVPLRNGVTLHHDIIGKYCATKVHLRSAPSGTGIIAGSSARAVFECLGIKDVVAKVYGSTNPYNVISAIFSALANVSTPRHVAERRGIKISDIVNRRDLFASSKVI